MALEEVDVTRPVGVQELGGLGRTAERLQLGPLLAVLGDVLVAFRELALERGGKLVRSNRERSTECGYPCG